MGGIFIGTIEKNSPKIGFEEKIKNFILIYLRLIVALIGIIFILISSIIEHDGYFGSNAIIVSLFRELGITFVIIGTILIFFERHLNKYIELKLEVLEKKFDRTLEEVLSNLKKTGEDFRRSGRLINEGMESGIVNIFLNRNTKEFQSRIHNELIKGEGEICIIGVALGDFFSGGHLYDALRSKIVDKNCNIQIRALLLNPFSRAARERARVENGDEFFKEPQYYKSPLFTDIVRSTNSIIDLRNKIENLKKSPEMKNWNCQLDVKFYDTDPQLYMVLLNKHLFVEQYHLSNLNIPGCIGRHVPVLEMSEKVFDNSELISNYRIMKEHFEYLWIRSETKDLNEIEECVLIGKKDFCKYVDSLDG